MGDFIAECKKWITIMYTTEKNRSLQLNGWTIYSSSDDEEYVNNPQNFEIASVKTIAIAPVMKKFLEGSGRI